MVLQRDTATRCCSKLRCVYYWTRRDPASFMANHPKKYTVLYSIKLRSSRLVSIRFSPTALHRFVLTEKCVEPSKKERLHAIRVPLRGGCRLTCKHMMQVGFTVSKTRFFYCTCVARRTKELFKFMPYSYSNTITMYVLFKKCVKVNDN